MAEFENFVARQYNCATAVIEIDGHMEGKNLNDYYNGDGCQCNDCLGICNYCDKCHRGNTFTVTYIDVDSGNEISKTFNCWKEGDEFVKLYQRNAIPAWHND